MHRIQHHILITLSRTKTARFRDMRPPKVDSNAYSYHLKTLQKSGVVVKHDDGYTLSPKGMAIVDRLSSTLLDERRQPKIHTMAALFDKDGRILMLGKSKQPFIGDWTMPNGQIHQEDQNIETAMRRELQERVQIDANPTLKHAAIVYIHSYIGDEHVSSRLLHIFTMQIDPNIIARQDVHWTDAKMRTKASLTPGVEEIIQLITTEQPVAFREFTIKN